MCKQLQQSWRIDVFMAGWLINNIYFFLWTPEKFKVFNVEIYTIENYPHHHYLGESNSKKRENRSRNKSFNHHTQKEV